MSRGIADCAEFRVFSSEAPGFDGSLGEHLGARLAFIAKSFEVEQIVETRTLKLHAPDHLQISSCCAQHRAFALQV
jgi:hypothetical protein